MANRNMAEREIRKLGPRGAGVGLTLPIELVRQLGWRLRQKLRVRRRGDKLVVEDWREKS